MTRFRFWYSTAPVVGLLVFVSGCSPSRGERLVQECVDLIDHHTFTLSGADQAGQDGRVMAIRELGKVAVRVDALVEEAHCAGALYPAESTSIISRINAHRDARLGITGKLLPEADQERMKQLELACVYVQAKTVTPPNNTWNDPDGSSSC